MSTPRLPVTSYAVLGLLSWHPMSGYDIAQAVDRSIANFWPIAKSQVYRELPRLEELGLVAGTDVQQVGVPNKRTYELTDDGAAALDAWLAGPDIASERTRSGMLVKLFFAHRMGAPEAAGLVGRHRSEAEKQASHLRRVVDELAGVPHARFSRLTALYGLRHAEATLAWADEVSRDLAEAPKRRRRAAGSASRTFAAIPPRTGQR